MKEIKNGVYLLIDKELKKVKNYNRKNQQSRKDWDSTEWKIGDWFIPHKPKDWLDWKTPYWYEVGMDKLDGKTLRVEGFMQGRGGQYLIAENYYFHPDWCEKTEEPKKEPQIGDDDNVMMAILFII